MTLEKEILRILSGKYGFYYSVRDCSGNLLKSNITEALDKKLHEAQRVFIQDRVLLHSLDDCWYEYTKDQLSTGSTIEFLHDVTLIKQKEDRLEIDNVTGLKQRDVILEQMKIYIEKALNRGEPFAIAMGDVDNFKEFNDQYGHPCGDYVLRLISEIQVTSLEENGGHLIGRYGGEEFILLLKNTTESATKRQLEKIRKKIAGFETMYEGKKINSLGISYGFCLFDPKKCQRCDLNKLCKDLISYADQALYYSKQHGRNKTTSYREYLSKTRKEDK